MTGARDPGETTLRFATVADVDAIAALHATRISDGFLVTLGPAFLRRLYGRIVRSSRAFVLVVEAPNGEVPNGEVPNGEVPNGEVPNGDVPNGGLGSGRVCGFIAVAENTGELYREYLRHDGVAAVVTATRGIVRAPRAMWETVRYGLRGGAHATGAEVLATAVAAECGQRGIATRLVCAAVDELRRRGAASARVVTAVGNEAAVRAYERGGFRVSGLDEVHRGVPQHLLVWP